MKVVVVLAVMVLGGCAPRVAAPPPPPIYCQQGEDCEIKWGRVLRWVTRNSYWKIKYPPC